MQLRGKEICQKIEKNLNESIGFSNSTGFGRYEKQKLGAFCFLQVSAYIIHAIYQLLLFIFTLLHLHLNK
jgi:hypothetical protein